MGKRREPEIRCRCGQPRYRRRGFRHTTRSSDLHRRASQPLRASLTALVKTYRDACRGGSSGRRRGRSARAGQNAHTEEAAREESRDSISAAERYIGRRLAASVTASGAPERGTALRAVRRCSRSTTRRRWAERQPRPWHGGHVRHRNRLTDAARGPRPRRHPGRAQHLVRLSRRMRAGRSGLHCSYLSRRSCRSSARPLRIKSTLAPTGFDDGRQPLLVRGAVGGGVGRVSSRSPSRPAGRKPPSPQRPRAPPREGRQLLHHGGGRPGRPADAAPRSDLEARQELRHGRDRRAPRMGSCEVTAKPRTSAERIRPSGPGILSNIMSTWPASRS